MYDVLAFQMEWNVLGRIKAHSLRFEVPHAPSRVQLIRQKAPTAAQDAFDVDARHNGSLQQRIAQIGQWKNLILAAVESAIPDQHKLAGYRVAPVADQNLRHPPAQCF